jgi:hypothetical protein
MRSPINTLRLRIRVRFPVRPTRGRIDLNIHWALEKAKAPAAREAVAASAGGGRRRHPSRLRRDAEERPGRLRSGLRQAGGVLSVHCAMGPGVLLLRKIRSGINRFLQCGARESCSGWKMTAGTSEARPPPRLVFRICLSSAVFWLRAAGLPPILGHLSASLCDFIH